jgi:hypothetical protein
MEVTARGWNRDMGKNTLATHDLSEIIVSRDPRRTLQWGSPAIFKSISEVGVHWRQKMSYTGNYRMEVNFSFSDVIRLFKAMNGGELDVDLLDNHGFTVSPELKKRILGEIRLADLTIGDLAGLGVTSKKAETQEETPATVRTFPRRI